MATRKKPIPDAEQIEKVIPDNEVIEKEIPDPGIKQIDIPKIGNPENTITIGGKLIEIKPMKLKYVRNRTAAFRHILETYPLSDILAMENSFGDGRDGDKALFDWLVAVTDNEQLISDNYDELDTETIYRLLAIHRRVDKVDELEAKLKNVVTPGEA
jgi:hypothetical protein